VEIKIQQLTDVKLPSYAHEGDSGMDLYSAVDEILKPSEIKLIPTGIKIAVPIGYEAQVRPKSGIALKNGVTVLNTPGTVDAGYRGEVGVILVNFGKSDFMIKKNTKIAQLVIAKVEHADIKMEENLDETKRNAGGFGSTGIN
jgi:dUTP pyrophosphatase